ncbi:MAG TPA: M20/M25/M40 family metallo-hydrolase [Terriglobales bacterium]|nr:M20/M25/M40 family metallo-hydrolase [Terriglobales bacterium]
MKIRNRLIAVFLPTLISSTGFAQTPNVQPTPPAWAAIPQDSESAIRAFPPKLRGELVQLRDAALADNYAYQQLEYITDSIGPRPQGSPQADAAAHYVADQLRKLGLDVHLEPVPVQRFERGTDAAELVEYPGQVEGTRQKIYVTALRGNSPTPDTGISADVVVVNNFDELKQLGRDKVAGKIVLFNEIFDHQKAISGQAGEAYREAVRYRASGAAAAAELGAVGSLVRSTGDGAYRLPHTGSGLDFTIPAGAVTAEDAGLISRLAARGRVRIHLTLTTKLGPQAQGYNVVAELKGSEHPEQVVIVSGHLDSWDLGTGAIDDGAGVVVAMEAAELLHKLNLHPRRTLRVVAWMNEEMGATGAEAYAKDYAPDIANHIAAIESDLGAEHPLGFHAKISEPASKQLSPVQEVLRAIGSNLIQIVPESPETDIEPLAKNGVPAFGIWQNGITYFTYHHTAADTLDKVDPQQLRENAACMAVIGYALADMAEPLHR